jgi:hypothetical protein
MASFSLFRSFPAAILSGCSAVGSAMRSGRIGRWFESSQPDHLQKNLPIKNDIHHASLKEVEVLKLLPLAVAPKICQ